MKRLFVLALLVGMALLHTGCIAIIERGTRGGKVGPMAGDVIRKGDKLSDVKARLGEPDDVTPVDATGAQIITYNAVKGFYAVVFGQFEFTTIRIKLVAGVVDDVHSEESGKDILILTGWAGGTTEPSFSR